jgi:hypothetical protein
MVIWPLTAKPINRKRQADQTENLVFILIEITSYKVVNVQLGKKHNVKRLYFSRKENIRTVLSR